MKKLIIEVDDYKLKSCERRANEGFNEWYHDLILNAKPLETELEDIKAEINAKERVELSTKEMWYNFALADVTHIIDNHIAELKGENDENSN